MEIVVCVVSVVVLILIVLLTVKVNENYGGGGPSIAGAVRSGSCPRKFNYRDDSWLYDN